MRKFMAAIGTAAVLLLTFAAGAFVCLLYRSPVFSEGRGYEFYLGKNSSACIVVSEDPVRDKLLLGGVEGESARFEGDRAEELIARFSARVLFTERAGDCMNYYCSSPLLGEGTQLFGCRVNLHICVRGTQTAAGTPLIYGGF